MTRAGLRVGSAIACVWTIGVADTHAQRLPVRCYGEADGLVQSSVTVAFQDRRGFLWIGTHDRRRSVVGVHVASHVGRPGARPWVDRRAVRRTPPRRAAATAHEHSAARHIEQRRCVILAAARIRSLARVCAPARAAHRGHAGDLWSSGDFR